MTEYKKYNCTGGLDEFSKFLRPAFGIGNFDIEDQLNADEKDAIKSFIKNVLGKKTYVQKCTRLFVKESDTYVYFYCFA